MCCSHTCQFSVIAALPPPFPLLSFPFTPPSFFSPFPSLPFPCTPPPSVFPMDCLPIDSYCIVWRKEKFQMAKGVECKWCECLYPSMFHISCILNMGIPLHPNSLYMIVLNMLHSARRKLSMKVQPHLPV